MSWFVMKKLLNKAGRNVRIGLVGEAILATLVVGVAVSTLVVFPGVAYIIAPFIKKKRYSPRQAISRNIDSLIKSGLVKQTKDVKGNPALKLTKRGVWEAMLRHHKMPSLPHHKKVWDKTWRMVIFDIPNEQNRKRSDLRRALYMYGFRSIQKSVWVYPHECDNFITLLKSHLGVARDVLYLKVSYIENDRHLRHEFSL